MKVSREVFEQRTNDLNLDEEVAEQLLNDLGVTMDEAESETEDKLWVISESRGESRFMVIKAPNDIIAAEIAEGIGDIMPGWDKNKTIYTSKWTDGTDGGEDGLGYEDIEEYFPSSIYGDYIKAEETGEGRKW